MIYSVDWALRKDFRFYNLSTEKVQNIKNSLEKLEGFLNSLNESTTFLIEQGGGDSFKIMAYRKGHVVLAVPGKRVKEFRDELALDKTELEKQGIADEADAILIGELYKQHPEFFREFSELDKKTAEVKVLFRTYMDLQKDKVREELRRQAFVKKAELLDISKDVLDAILEQKAEVVHRKNKECLKIAKELEKRLSEFDIYQRFLRNVKGIGVIVSAGLISELWSKTFDSKDAVKCYAGMLKKKGNHNYNRYLKVILYQASQGFLKNSNPRRVLYDESRAYYEKIHPDWSKGKLHNYALKKVQTKFLLEVWEQMEQMKC